MAGIVYDHKWTASLQGVNIFYSEERILVKKVTQKEVNSQILICFS